MESVKIVTTQSSSKLIIFGKLDRADHVADAGNAHQTKVGDNIRINSLGNQVFPAFGFIKKPDNLDHRLIIDRHDHVSIFAVMDPWDVFVSDAFDAVLTVSVVE